MPATAIGAATGGVTNFMLGRASNLQAMGSHPASQAARYVAVSLASLGWNTVGEWLLAVHLGVQFQLARAIVAVVVSLAWNFPMQRAFVFRAA